MAIYETRKRIKWSGRDAELLSPCLNTTNQSTIQIMKDLGITKGEWFWDGDPSNYDPEQEAPWLLAGDKAEKIVIYGEIKITNIKDAELIADAGNTAQKCGLLPSELLKQRDELKEALVSMVWQFAYRGTFEGRENLYTGGLSALEDAFEALGLADPVALLDFDAEINPELKYK